MAKKYKVFVSKQESQEWISKNCDTCKKGFERKRSRFRCEWERKLCAASIYGDPVSEETARAIGYFENKVRFRRRFQGTLCHCIIWECPGWERGRG